MKTIYIMACLNICTCVACFYLGDKYGHNSHLALLLQNKLRDLMNDLTIKRSIKRTLKGDRKQIENNK